MKELLRRVWADDQAQDLIEYVLLVALISVVLIAAMNSFAGGISGVFSEAVSGMTP